MQFISLVEAAAVTGKTLITIRRLAKKPESKPFTKLEAGKLYIDKGYLLRIYPAVTTQPEYAERKPDYATTTQNEYAKSTQPTQNEYAGSIQEPTQPTQTDNMSTQALIQALQEQYEGRIKDLKEALESKEREIERISILFNQQQKLEMARATLPAKTNNYTESEPVEPEPVPAPKKRRRWFSWF